MELAFIRPGTLPMMEPDDLWARYLALCSRPPPSRPRTAAADHSETPGQQTQGFGRRRGIQWQLDNEIALAHLGIFDQCARLQTVSAT